MILYYLVVDPKDPKIVYDWFEVGVLDYDEKTQQFLVQKTNNSGRVLDSDGKPVVDGGIQADGKRRVQGVHEVDKIHRK